MNNAGSCDRICELSDKEANIIIDSHARIDTIESELAEMLQINSQLESDIFLQDKDFSWLSIENSQIGSEIAEIQRNLHSLHPLPYARLHLQKCIDRQKACNDAVNAFIHQCTSASVSAYSSLSLTLQLRELKRNLKKAWDARFAAAFLCQPPPIFEDVLWIVAKSGYTKEMMRCLNLNQAMRSCTMLQPVMREVKDSKGMTQLNYFASKGFTSSVKRMSSMKGIDLETRDDEENTPLKSAALHGHPDSLIVLLNRGAEIDAKNINGCTPLHHGCQNGHYLITSLLIARGANLEARTSVNGDTPLMRSISVDCSSLLLDNGAKIDALNYQGRSAIHTACLDDRVEIVELLIDRGANLEIESDEGLRPLHIAAGLGHIRTVKALIVDGLVNMNARTRLGHTALGDAIRFDQSKVAAYLQNIGALDDEGDEDEWEQIPPELLA